VPSALVDTGPLVALLHRGERWHAAARRFFMRFEGELLTTWPVITEAAYLCGEPRKSRDLMEMIESGALKIPPQTTADAARIKWYLRKYEDHDPDLADLSLLALAEAAGVTSIATLDRKDFDTYRLKSGKRLQNLIEI
jgi:uncharacterized protein